MIKSIRPSLAEHGKIKIGGKGDLKKSKSGGTYRIPKKFDHFVVTTNEKDGTDNFMPDKKIMDKLKNPNEINIRLPYDNPELNFLTRLAFYKGHKLMCSGDGEKADRLKKDKKGELTKKTHEIVCDPHICPYHQNKQCKASGLLSVILPDAEQVGGFYKFRTSSWNSIQQIMSSLAFIKSKTAGILANIPLVLEIIIKQDANHGKLTTVNIKYNGNMESLRASASDEMVNRAKFNLDIKQIESDAIKAGITNDNDDPTDVEDEFYTPKDQETNVVKTNTINADSFATPATSETAENKTETGNAEKVKKGEKIETIEDGESLDKNEDKGVGDLI